MICPATMQPRSRPPLRCTENSVSEGLAKTAEQNPTALSWAPFGNSTHATCYLKPHLWKHQHFRDFKNNTKFDHHLHSFFHHFLLHCLFLHYRVLHYFCFLFFLHCFRFCYLLQLRLHNVLFIKVFFNIFVLICIIMCIVTISFNFFIFIIYLHASSLCHIAICFHYVFLCPLWFIFCFFLFFYFRKTFRHRVLLQIVGV